MAQAKNLRAVGDRIEALTGELRSLPDPRARETAEELVRLLVDFYGEGLARVLEIVYESPGAGELFDRFANDEPSWPASCCFMACTRCLSRTGFWGLWRRFVPTSDRTVATSGSWGSARTA